MTVNNKTRKLFWGRSGNRCAICKSELILSSTDIDNESIVGEECHIISPRFDGPRYDPAYPKEKLDSYENLILLCGTHHKMVDDQIAAYESNVLRLIKSQHEVWISEKLEIGQKQRPIKIKRVKKYIPSFLFRLTTGKEVMNIVSGAMAFSFDNDELKLEEEVELIGGFLQEVQDFGDLSPELEAGEKVKTDFNLSKLLNELEEKGFLVFGARELQILEGGIRSGVSGWPIAIIRVLRQESKEIIKINNNDINNSNKR